MESSRKRLGVDVFEQAEIIVIKLSGQASPEGVQVGESIAMLEPKATVIGSPPGGIAGAWR